MQGLANSLSLVLNFMSFVCNLKNYILFISYPLEMELPLLVLFTYILCYLFFARGFDVDLRYNIKNLFTYR